MGESLKHKTVRGVIWSGIERFSTQAVQLVVNILLMRLLVPGDFGLIAEIFIFIQLAQLLIDSGFSTALIRRKDRNDLDFSTIFYFNLAVSLICYGILFIGAPLISRFYNEPVLTPLVRVLGLNFVIGALVAVPRTMLTIEIRFKEQSIISLAAALVSGAIAVWLAFMGMGVWSLVVQTLLSVCVQAILTWMIVRWLPKSGFSWERLKSMLGYSSKLLISSLINMTYVNLYPMLIGKFYNKTELGYYNRGDYFAMVPAQSIGQIISRVAFPVFSSIQDDNARLRTAYSKYIRYASTIVFPLMLGIAMVAKPLVLTILPADWLPAVPILQILCIAWMFDHISQINLNILYVKGRSDLALRLEIIKKTIAFTILFATVPFGIIAICYGRVAYSIIALILNTHYTSGLISLSRKQQLLDFLPPLFTSVAMGLAVWLLTLLPLEPWLQLTIAITGGIVSYMALTFFTQRRFFYEFISLIHKNG